MPNSVRIKRSFSTRTTSPRERISHFQLVHRRRVAALSAWKLVSTTCALVRYTNTRVHISFPLHPRFWNDAGHANASPLATYLRYISYLHYAGVLFCLPIVLPAHPLHRESNFFQKEKKTSRSVSQTIKRAPTPVFALRLKYCVVWIERNVKSIVEVLFCSSVNKLIEREVDG